MKSLYLRKKLFKKINTKQICKTVSKLFFSLIKQVGSRFVDVIVVLIISILIFAITSNKLPSLFTNERTMEKIKGNFKGSYEVKIKEINLNSFGKNSLLVIANDRRYKEQCAMPFRDEEEMKNFNFPKLNTPVIELWDAVDNPLERLNIFNLPYNKAFSFSVNPNSELWVYKTTVIDLDNDDQKEVVVELIGSLCGSGSSDIYLVFGRKNGKFDLLESLPDVHYLSEYVENRNIDIQKITENIKSDDDYNKIYDGFTEKSKIRNNYTNLEYNIEQSHLDEYKKFTDIDGDGLYELIFAHPHCWGIQSSSESCKKERECHWCDHTWLVGVYKYINGKYYVDNKWNSGQGVYIIPKKIDLYDAHGYARIPNIVGFVSQFYLEGSDDDSRNLFDPTWVYTRRNSEIEKIVKELYGK